MLVVALTGGIGSGKSTVADAFAEHGVPLIDTDIIARDLVTPGSIALQEIVTCFGHSVLTPQGELDRAALREIVFADAEKRKQLEQILHPRIRQEVQQRLSEIVAPYCLVIIPLLIETGDYPFVNRVLVVDAAEETRIRRTMARDGLTRQEVEQILASQANREQRRAAADDLIENDADRADLEKQVASLHQHYLRLSSGSVD